MLYCCREHQVADRNLHKGFCNTIKQKRDHLEREEKALRENPGDGLGLPANVFENSVGHFWGIWPTRDYMRARYALIEALWKVPTFDAVQTALEHALDINHLNRSDNMNVRSVVPALFIRLDRDQDCYDYVKWWQTMGQDSDYRWGDISLPFLNIKNANAFEPIDYMCSKYPDLSQIVAITLLKIRLLLDLQSLQNCAVLDGQVPAEIITNIEDFVPRSQILRSQKKSMSREKCLSLTKELKLQIDLLYKTVNEANRFFWPALLNPGDHIPARPSAYSPGSREEMQLYLQYSIDAWTETPGALEMIQDRMPK